MLIQIATVEELKDALEKVQKGYAEACAAQDEADKRYTAIGFELGKMKKAHKSEKAMKPLRDDLEDAYAAVKRLNKERMSAYRVLRDTQNALDAAERAE